MIAALVASSIVGIGFFLSPQSRLQTADIIVAVSGGETQQRTSEAVSLYKQGRAAKLLFSGAAADPNSPSNAAAMRADALRQGVPDSAILTEELSTNTEENAQMAQPIIENLGAKSIILVTSPYHQRRASLNFRQALGPEFVIINHSASDSSWRKSNWWQQDRTIELTLSELQKTLYVWSVRRQDG